MKGAAGSLPHLFAELGERGREGEERHGQGDVHQVGGDHRQKGRRLNKEVHAANGTAGPGVALIKAARKGIKKTSTAGRRLEYFTLTWNLIEAAVAVGAGLLAGSIALVGFGVDSVIESLSGGVLLWRLWTHEADERRERLALRLVGVSFLVLAAYVGVEAAKTLLEREAPESSWVGIGLSVASLLVMPVLARAKRRVACRLGSDALRADSRQTDLCAWLSAILLGGLGLHALAGWWWADPAAALAMVPIIVREGVGALRGEADPCGCQ
jgi:divalent metal cation (Fe/Co/Zn/Cd) transporter